MTDLDLRKVRYFVAVADEGTFGRSADKLHIAQPVLSRQIRVLESELGASLFDRSTRGTALTPAGAALLDDARALLSTSRSFQRRARISGRANATFTIGFMPGLTVANVVTPLAARFPRLRVDVLRTSWTDQVESVLDGRVDVGFVRLPIPRRGLTIVPLYSEPRVVALPASHPLATHPAVTIRDLAPFDLLQDPDVVPEWRDAAEAMRPGGLATLPADLPRPLAVEEKYEYVAAGVGVVIVPESAAQLYTRSDVVYRRVTDLPPTEVALAYAARRETVEIEALVEIAQDLQGRARDQPASVG
jgi:DNA-binding transcriptional LysR family regulator